MATLKISKKSKKEYDCHTVEKGQRKVISNSFNLMFSMKKAMAWKYWKRKSFWKTQIGFNWILWRNKSDRLHEKGRKRRAKKKQPKVEISQFCTIHNPYQIYLDPSGGDCEPEEGIDREDEESGFEVKKCKWATFSFGLFSHQYNNALDHLMT